MPFMMWKFFKIKESKPKVDAETTAKGKQRNGEQEKRETPPRSPHGSVFRFQPQPRITMEDISAAPTRPRRSSQLKLHHKTEQIEEDFTDREQLPLCTCCNRYGILTAYAVITGGRAALVPFYALFFRHLGLNVTQAGIILGSRHLCLAIISTWWAHVIPRLKNLFMIKVLMIGAVIVTVVANFLLVIVPGTGAHTTSECQNRSTPLASGGSEAKKVVKRSAMAHGGEDHLEHVRILNDYSSFKKSVHDDLVTSKRDIDARRGGAVAIVALHSAISLEDSRQQSDNIATLFLPCYIIAIMEGAMSSAVNRVMDNVLYANKDVDCFDTFKTKQTISNYVTAFSAFSSGLVLSFSPCIKFVHDNQYNFAVLALAIAGAICALIFYGIPIRKAFEQPHNGPFIGFKLINYDSSLRLILYAFTASMMGFTHASIYVYLFWRVKEHGGGEFLLGTALAVSCMCDVVVLRYGPGVVGKLSISKMISLCILCQIIRLVIYAIIDLSPPWIVVALEAFNILSYSFFWINLCMYLEYICIPGMERDLYFAFTSFYWEGGYGLGCIVCGIIYSAVNKLLFLIVAGLTLLWLIVFVFVVVFVKKLREKDARASVTPDHVRPNIQIIQSVKLSALEEDISSILAEPEHETLLDKMKHAMHIGHHSDADHKISEEHMQTKDEEGPIISIANETRSRTRVKSGDLDIKGGGGGVSDDQERHSMKPKRSNLEALAADLAVHSSDLKEKERISKMHRASS